MAYSFCRICNCELNRPELSEYQFGGSPKCPDCNEERDDCDRSDLDDLMIEEIIDLKEEIKKLNEQITKR